MKKKSTIHLDVWLAIALLLMSGYVFLSAMSFPTLPARFPKVFSCFLAVLSLFILRSGIKKTKQGESMQEVEWKTCKYGLAVGGLVLLYAIAIDLIGFFVATTAFMIISMLFMGVKSKLAIVLTTLGTNLVVWIVFVNLLSVRLP